MILANSAVTGGTNKNLYNGGSEWQNDYSNLPDYYQTFYRNYDAAIGRFVAVDPMPESAESMIPYQYAENNPVMMNDPGGDLSRPNVNRVQPEQTIYDFSGMQQQASAEATFANDGFMNWAGNGGYVPVQYANSNVLLQQAQAGDVASLDAFAAQNGGLTIGGANSASDLFNTLASGAPVSVSFQSDGSWEMTYSDAEINVANPNDNRGGVIALGYGGPYNSLDNADQGGNGNSQLLELGLMANEAGEKTGTIMSSALYLAKKSGVSEEALAESFSGTSALKIAGRVTGVINIVNNGSKFFEDPRKNWWNGVEALGQSTAMIVGYLTGVEEVEIGYNAVTTGIDLGVDYYKHKIRQ